MQPFPGIPVGAAALAVGKRMLRMGLCHSSSGLCHFVPKIATMRGGFILSWTHGGGP